MTNTTTLHTLALLFALFAHAAVAHAQVAVLRIDPEAEAVCRDVERALQGVGVVPDPGYLEEARRQDMDPTSDGALELITPLLQIKLAVVPLFVDDATIEVEYRDGGTGARLGKASIPRERGKLGATGRAQLRSDVVTQLGALLEGSAEPEGDSPAPDQEAADAAPRSIRAVIRMGMGIGMRDVEWTLDGETQSVAMGAFPAVDLGLAFAFRLNDTLSFVPALSYQSSLFFHEVEETRTAAPSEKVGVRAHRFAATLGLAIRLGGDKSASITPALGLGVRNLRPEAHHLSTPAFSLAGPLLQLGVHLPITDVLSLQLVPEAQYLFVGEGLRERDVESNGLSLGGELAIAYEIIAPLALELAYRESHALLSAVDGDAGDVERFVTFRAAGTL